MNKISMDWRPVFRFTYEIDFEKCAKEKQNKKEGN